ncbi:hypothetical protein KP509_18G039700 [Ceratopteris richardii]|nr:hypothetical protein KP509_18G039700 [Ceratopteris richardii]
MHKMSSIYEQPVVMKYQLPNEDLDALISIACDEDVENMMDEYDRLQASEAGSNRLRIFLFSPADYDAVHVTSPVDARNTDQIYMDAINGMPELRSVSLLPLQCPNILTAQQATDSFATSQVFSKTTHVSPTVSNPQLIPLGVQHALIQSNWQVMPRVLSVSPSSTPPSPTVSLQLNTFRQQDISDVAHSYGDQVLKGPVAHQRDVQRMDTVYRDLECVGSGNSSFNSQHDGSCRQIDSTRLSDSPKKSQLEAFFDHSHHQEQINMADPVLCRMPPMNALADSHGRLSRVVLNRNLMASKQQQTEVIGQPVSERLVDLHPLDTQQRPSDVQHTCLAPSAWIHNRETRREDFQYPDTFRPTAIDSMQAAPPSRQPDAASYNQPSLSSGSISSLHVQRPVTSQTIVHAAGTLHPVLGQVSPAALHPASGSSSPRSKLQDTNLNTAPGYQVFVGHRGLKPLNVRADPAEQLTLLSNEQAGRPQVQSPLSKPQEIQKFRQQGADALHGYMRDSLEPNTPPYPGGSPYHGQFTAFEDPITSRRDEYGLEHAHYDCAFAAHSNNLENVGRTMWTPDNEMTCIRPWAAGHKELRGDANFSLCHCQAGESNAAPSSLEKSSLNSQAASIINVGPHSLSEMMGFSTSTVPSPLFDRVRGLTTSSHVPPLNEPLFASPILLSTVTNEQAPGEVAALTSSMSPKAGNPTANPNSFFVADVVDEGQWIKGIQDGARILNDFQRPGSKIQINEGLHSGAVGGRSTDEDNEQICTPSIDTGDLIGNLSKPVVDAHAGNVEISPPLARHALDTEASLFSLPPSPHLSAGTATHGSSFLVLESLQPTCLTETSKNFPSNMQKNDGEFPESISDHDKAHIGQDANLLLPALFSKSMEPKQDLPIFDTAPAEEEDTGCTPNSEALTNVNANVDLLSTTLYAAPTLSMQNWEENMLDLKLEELVIESDKVDIQSPDEKEILALKNEALEGKRGDAPDDIEGSTVNMNPAAIAEAEAVSRGLQTIKDSDLEELRELGTGTFGTVYYGKWRGTDVAIKRIKASCFSGRPSERDRLIADFWKEAYILGQLHHPNIVAFYGVVPDGPGGTLATVTEYMVNGSLKQVLQKKDRTIDRRKRLLIIMDAAFGMEYLHGKNVVHFDLKCENLLVNMKDPQRPVCKFSVWAFI